MKDKEIYSKKIGRFIHADQDDYRYFKKPQREWRFYGLSIRSKTETAREKSYHTNEKMLTVSKNNYKAESMAYI